MLSGGAVISKTVLVASPAIASSVKVSQSQAKYLNSPRGNARCDRCIQFQPPSACKIVDGAVSPTGSCLFFAPRPR